jgi:putative ATP-dependent endonuclease of the OLD family
MRIRYLEIKNFRGIKSLSATFEGGFICLIGPGDSCKSTIITAIDYALSSRWNLGIDDADFYNQDIENPISISITLSGWNRDSKEAKKLFTEKKFGQLISGIDQKPVAEPLDDAQEAITVNLSIDKSLEPKWQVIKEEEEKNISAADRNCFGAGRIDAYLDNNFAWGRNSILTRLSGENNENLNLSLAEIARSIKDNTFDLKLCDSVASSIRDEAEKIGVKLSELSPKLDVQKLTFSSGALTLHYKNIPLRNLGSGSKKLISLTMQMKLHDGHNIALIDEIEAGLEPHRIRGLIKTLKQSKQQVISATHSPVVLRELIVAKNELYVCRRDDDGTVNIKSIKEVPNSQGPVRSNPEAFLGKKIIVCEGATEIGCLRALDQCKIKDDDGIPVWTLNTAYFNAGGIGNIKKNAIALNNLGYKVAVFCDNDEPDQFSGKDKLELENVGIKVICWDEGNSIEQQLFFDLKWLCVLGFFDELSKIHDSKDKMALIQSVQSKMDGLKDDYATWIESDDLRKTIGIVAAGKNQNGIQDSKKAWFKRINYAEAVFRYAIPQLISKKTMMKSLDALWGWVQSE